MIDSLLYIGPGLGLGAIVLIVIILLIIIVSFVAILWIPINKFFKKLFGKKSSE